MIFNIKFGKTLYTWDKLLPGAFIIAYVLSLVVTVSPVDSFVYFSFPISGFLGVFTTLFLGDLFGSLLLPVAIFGWIFNLVALYFIGKQIDKINKEAITF